jgi:hypothetical protein
MANEGQQITLYLTSWQKRMIKDFFPAKLLKAKSMERASKIRIAIFDKKQWVMYRQPIEAFKTGQLNLYLSDEQIAQVAEITGVPAKFSALNVSPELLESGQIAVM